MDFCLFGVNRAKDGRVPSHAKRRAKDVQAGVPIGTDRPVLFHPDYTVGPGIQPGLLTSATPSCHGIARALAGYVRHGRLPPVGNCTPPRERVLHGAEERRKGITKKAGPAKKPGLLRGIAHVPARFSDPDFIARDISCRDWISRWRKRKIEVTLPPDLAVDAEVDLDARLNVSSPGVAKDAAQALVHAAHQTCPYSKATRGNIEIAISLV